MPPKKGTKKKKKAAEPKEPPFPIPRDLSESAPIDAHDGLLGIEHCDVTARVKAVKYDLVLWKLSEAVRNGDLDVDLADMGLDTLPDETFELPWLQVVDLSKNRFVNSVVEDLRRLPNLRGIDLSTNLLHGPLPETFGSLPATVEEICLDENVITSIPESTAALGEMTWFSIRKNLLDSFPATCFATWTKIEHLDLRNNKIKEIPPELGNCVELRALFLSSNQLTSLPESIGDLANLEVLHAQKNSLTVLPPSLARCTELVDLDVSFNKLAELPRELCASATGMERLIAASNKIGSIPEEIGMLTELKTLSLAGNSISSLPESMGALTKLTEIYLNGNPLTSLPTSISGWSLIEEASFKGCKLKALPIEVSAGWTKIQSLDVRAKKKDTCKVAPEFRDAPAMRRAHTLGLVLAKAKKKKGAKK